MNFEETAKQLGILPKIIKNQHQAYRSFSNSVWSKGVLSTQEKEIIAVAVAHSTKCAYCIRFHTKKAKQANVSPEALAEAIFVTAAIEAGTTLSAYVNELTVNNQSFPHHAEAISTFLDLIEESEFLTARLKLLIALSVSFAIQSTKHIQFLTDQATQRGITKEEIAEAAVIASALKAGGAISHFAEALDEYQND